MKTNWIQISKALPIFCMMAACTGAELDKAATTSDKAQTYQLIRNWKRVTRYNCAGEVTSDQVETVRSPNKYVTVEPKVSQNLYSARFTNLRNNSKAGMVTGRNSFTIDIAPTLLNMKVEEGLNQIQYEFLYCDELMKDKKGQPTAECNRTPEVRESGTIYIRVEYIQNWLDGQDIVSPSEDECKQLEEEAQKKDQTPV